MGAVVPFGADNGKREHFQRRLATLYNSPSLQHCSPEERQRQAIKIATDMGWHGPDGIPYTPENLCAQHQALFPTMAAANDGALLKMQALQVEYAASLAAFSASQPAGDDHVPVEAELQVRKGGGRKGGLIAAGDVITRDLMLGPRCRWEEVG